ncbi:RICIN domain-containing protein [Streptomyces rectiverticillatus]|uniref:RICIN domain-containing protein n=1 Tax=Streptomyces rectiverticillatus TaxID=173860 RepID=UPI0015C301DE|nr:RICIN domain-containing protein [Streptomyces rectiverticillatus]QLE72869.1 RICIN domain-containing protein [Streptomyces rectiverticillatus]
MSVHATTTYLVRNEKTGLYLTVRGLSRHDAADIVQEPLHDWPQRASQAWRLEPGQGGEHVYRLQNQHSGRYLQVRYCRKDPGAPAEQRHLEENDPAYQSQTWEIRDDDDRRIVNVHSGLGLNVRGHSAAAGAVVEQQAGDEENRVWRFEAVEPRGEAKLFHALAGTVVEPSSLGILATLTNALKASLEASGGIFGTVSKWVPGSTTPYIVFDGFRGEEVVRFSQRNRVEAGPRKISEQFPHLPKEFHGGFDFVTRAPGWSEHRYVGVKGDLAVEFSDRSSGESLRSTDFYFPREQLEPVIGGAVKAAVQGTPDGRYQLVFGEKGATALIDVPRGPAAGKRGADRRDIRPVRLDHLPEPCRPDAIASAAVGDEMHFFAVKGDQYLVFTFREVIHGPGKILDAYPFLLGLWG